MPKHDPTEKTKQEILRTALRLFMDKGWDKVNIEDIVKEVGVTRGAFYHYFKSREALILAAVDQMFFDDNPFIEAHKQEGLNALEKLRFALKLNLSWNFENTGMTAELRKVMEDPIMFKSEYVTQVNTVAPYIEALIIEGNKDGSMSVAYPRQLAQLIALLPNFFLSPVLFKVSYEEFADKIAFFVQMTETLGLPIVDAELKKEIMKAYDVFT